MPSENIFSQEIRMQCIQHNCFNSFDANSTIDRIGELMSMANHVFERKSRFSQLCDFCIDSITSYRSDDISMSLLEFGNGIKNRENCEVDNDKVKLIVLLICSIVTNNSFSESGITFNAELFSRINTKRIVINALWCLSISFIYINDISCSIFQPNVISPLILENVDISADKSIASSVLTLFANFASDEEGRNEVIESLGIDTLFSLISSYENICKNEVEHLLHNIFRYKIITGDEESYEEEKSILSQLLSKLLMLQDKHFVLNCYSLASSNNINFNEFINQVPQIIDFANQNTTLDGTQESIDMCASCVRILGQTCKMNIDIGSYIFNQIFSLLDEGSTLSYNSIASVTCWAIYKSNMDNVERAFETGLVDQLFTLTNGFSFECKKHSIICLSNIAILCSTNEELAKCLIEKGIIQTIAPLARLSEKPKTNEVILSAIIALSCADEAIDLLGDSIYDLADSEDETVSYIAESFIEQLTD